MKKFLSILLSAALLVCLCVFASAESTDTLSFNDDGTFKIMMINDTQDVGSCNSKLTEFLNAALDAEQPDLAVFAGDQLSDFYPLASASDYEKAIANIITPLSERGIPFLVTLGNHDHDRASKLSEDGMYAIYTSYDNCYMSGNGCDNFTCSVPVYSSTGSDVVFNIYMMDTNNKDGNGEYAGINATQLEWYINQSNTLKAQNNNESVPSLLFQHVPVKEIYNLLKAAGYSDDGAVYSRRDKTWYVLDTDKATGTLGEAPCSEAFTTVTGQYQAWLSQGDIMGAFFAHDHVNNFVGTTDDGITLGYNGGTGFRAYGNGSGRSVRVFELNESAPEEYTTRIVTYADVTGNNFGKLFVDIASPTLLTTLMKVVYVLFGWSIDLLRK